MATRCKICNTPISVQFKKGKLDSLCSDCKEAEAQNVDFYNWYFEERDNDKDTSGLS